MSLIKLDELKVHLKIKTSETGADAKLEDYIRWVSAQIVSWCRQPFIECERTIVFSAFYSFGQKTYTLPFLNNKVEAVGFFERQTPGDEWVENTDIKLLNEGLTPQLYLRTGFVEGCENYRAVLKVGFTLADATAIPPVEKTIPDDIERVVVEMCRELAMEAGLLGESTFKTSSISVAYNGTTTTKNFLDMSPRWKFLLKPYRAPIL